MIRHKSTPPLFFSSVFGDYKYATLLPAEEGKRFKINSVSIGYGGTASNDTPSCDIALGVNVTKTTAGNILGRINFTSAETRFRCIDFGGYVVPDGGSFTALVYSASSTTIVVNYEVDDGL